MVLFEGDGHEAYCCAGGGGVRARGAGVKAGDILLTIDGASMRGLRRVIAQLDDESVGRSVTLRLIRGGEVLTMNVVITARPRD